VEPNPNVYDVLNNLLNVLQTVALAFLAVKAQRTEARAQKIEEAVNGG
jgi:hypothetical protein